MAETGRIPVPLRLCRGCRRFVRLDGRPDCVFCGCDLDSLEAEHESNLAELRRAAAALREALARPLPPDVDPDGAEADVLGP